MTNFNAPLLAIKCTTYNHELYVCQCLDGFIMQKTNFPFIAIVHDDASTDNTAEIIRKYAEKYPDIIKPIYENENQYSKRDGSIERIMNNAIPDSVKYIAICEGDDYWIDPNKLQKQVDFLESHPECSMCFHRTKEIVEKEIDSHIPLAFNHITEGYYSGEQILKKWSVPTASVVYRNYTKYLNQKCPGIIHGDIFTFLLLAEKGLLYCLPDVMSVYRRNISNITYKLRGREFYQKSILHYKALKNFFWKKYDNILNDKINYCHLALFKAEFPSLQSLYYLACCLKHPFRSCKNITAFFRKKYLRNCL